jgi:hypothetical protein
MKIARWSLCLCCIAVLCILTRASHAAEERHSQTQEVHGGHEAHDPSSSLTQDFWDAVVKKLLSIKPPSEKMHPFGGPGGAQFARFCYEDKIVVGVNVRHGEVIDDIQLECIGIHDIFKYDPISPSNAAKTTLTDFAGDGTGGVLSSGTLPRGFAMKGFTGQVCAYGSNDDAVMCRMKFFGAEIHEYGVNDQLVWSNRAPFGKIGGGSPTEKSFCGPGAVVTGLHGKIGTFLDSAGVICTQITSLWSTPPPMAVSLDLSDPTTHNVQIGSESGAFCDMSCDGPVYGAHAVTKTTPIMNFYSSFFAAAGESILHCNSISTGPVTDFSNKCGKYSDDLVDHVLIYPNSHASMAIAIGIKTYVYEDMEGLTSWAPTMAPLDRYAKGAIWDPVVRTDLAYNGLVEAYGLIEGTGFEPPPFEDTKEVLCKNGFALSKVHTRAGTDVDKMISIECSRILINGTPGY